MPIKAKIIAGKYLDSVKLMLISRELRSLKGVLEAVAIVATSENREILKASDMLAEEINSASENDIVIVIKADNAKNAAEAINKAEELINKPSTNEYNQTPIPQAFTLEKAIATLGGADLCLISIAGKYAAAEAEKALEKGLHILLFSDNVSIEDELSLKQKALKKGLLMMGPDCGTAILNGVPLAFANNVPRGKIGIVSASGTGLQEISTTIANLSGGISQAFGTGGRDGKKEIGGLMLTACLEYLLEDENTEVIIVTGKPPCEEVQKKLWELISHSSKPVIANFLIPMQVPELPNLYYVRSLSETAFFACKKAGIEVKNAKLAEDFPLPKLRGPYLRGLYSGGTLCQEAIQVYLDNFGCEPFNNVTDQAFFRLTDGWQTKENSIIDLGADEFTIGRPHPMIDYSLRLQKLAQEANDPKVGIILLDVVLGFGAHPDPAEELVPALQKLPADLVVVCHLLGTDGDPQNRQKQKKELEKAGAYVFTSHHSACEFVCQCLRSYRSAKC
ncbi:acyl-CoA synthetase FdrA [Candidatus Cloacimonas acidaminovorans]|uniref:FdrA n=1 Tax=Cloacimonas acidaminovorans (strain Evry) TaxID=459349 RepID=B0VJR0_CLOAI|nr:acyl-CoA synthetase FdrA [Candidatus Cloacimonas acidaminovorans]CAO81438.1 FdrA [Candidatus Cloacimonas acidaminovorans str. Evry]